MKTFLLICGCDYYPCSGDGDWRGCYATHEEAEKAREEKWRKGSDFDWYDIIDLKNWMYDLPTK